jgi:hypothetical protein
MKVLKVATILSALSLLLAACGSAQQPFPEVSSAAGSQANDSQAAESAGQAVPSTGMTWMDGQSREDAQGAVTILVTGKALNTDAGTLEFEVVMDTHSVELNMDLATLATLTTNTGVSVDGLTWITAETGHHVTGMLSFRVTQDGVSILDGATELTLTIRNVDAAERIFTWQAQS